MADIINEGITDHRMATDLTGKAMMTACNRRQPFVCFYFVFIYHLSRSVKLSLSRRGTRFGSALIQIMLIRIGGCYLIENGFFEATCSL